ncbi:MAG: hypothetical protein M5U28_45840 [Sandaracinaceae bacterium]|nr:hypothetical protein [Sandaracinaceae bacterium]
MWGDEVLHVAHVSPPRDVVIGEAGAGAAPDYLVGREVLGADRLPLVVERDGRLSCVIPEGASGEVRVGESVKSLAALEAEGKLAPFADVPGARLYPLPDEASARIEHRGLAFLVRPTAAARAVGTATGLRLRHTGWIGLSLAVHAAFLVMFYFMPPRTSALSLDDISASNRMVEYLMETPAEEEVLPEWTPQPEESGGESGERHAGEEGAMGDPEGSGRAAAATACRATRTIRARRWRASACATTWSRSARSARSTRCSAAGMRPPRRSARTRRTATTR